MTEFNKNSRLLIWIEGHIGKLCEDSVEKIKIAEKHFKENKTIELSNQAFNIIHSKDKQKKLGITYTPQQIRREIINKCIKTRAITTNIKNTKICDPACGSGLFIIDIIDELRKYSFDIVEISKSIYLYDIDRASVAVALTNIYCHLEREKCFDDLIKFNVGCIDFFDVDEKFDYVITNPPYVKLQNIPDEQRIKLKEKYPEIFTGSIGLASLFLMKIYESLKKDGVAGLITQNNFFTSNSSKELRRLIQKNLIHIDNFGSEKIFDAVTAYTCLMYLSKVENKNFGYRKINGISDFNETPTIINSDELKYEKWRLGTDKERKILKTMESKGIPLGNACKIWVGIATQFDKAFTVHRKNNIWYGINPDGQAMEVESSIVKNLIKISEFNSSNELKTNARGVIYPYEIISNKAIVFKEDYLIKNYPKAYSYLETWRDELLSREKGRTSDSDWFKWGRVQSMIPVKGKLLTKTFSHGPAFFYDDTDALFSNGYALTIKDSRFSLDYIQAILNSNIFWNYSKLTSFEIEGDYQCYQKNFIERFCIPIISECNQRELLKANKITEFLSSHYEME